MTQETNFLDSNFLDRNMATLDDICGNSRLEKITTPTIEDSKKYQRLNLVYTITLPLE